MFNDNFHEEEVKKNREFANAQKVSYNNESDTKIHFNYDKVNPNSTDDKTPSSIINEKDDSKNQIKMIFRPRKQNDEKDKRNDYFFPKLCKFLTEGLIKEVKKLTQDEKFKINPPIEEISHMCLKNQYIFWNVLFKNFFTMKLEDKFEFFRLLFELGIIEKSDEKKEENLSKKQKAKAFALVRKFNYINEENTNTTDNEIKTALKKLLKDFGYKNHNETNFNSNDKITFLKLLIEHRIVTPKHNQEKNKEIIKALEAKGIKLLDMTFMDFLLYLFSKKNNQEYLADFQRFYNDVERIDDHFFKEKKNHLITVERDIKGYIDYVESYNKLNSDKREKLKNVLEYFKDKEINVDEIKKYKKIHNVK